MSVVINYASKYIALIATDTRITWGKHGEFGYTDGNEKLIDLHDLGWAAGAGLSSFLDSFKKKLGEEDIRNTDRIKEIFDEIYDNEVKQYPYYQGEIDQSVASASWLGMSNDDIFLRVGIFSKSIEGTMGFMLNDRFYLFYPSNYLEDLKLVRDFENNNDLIFTYDYMNPSSLQQLIQKVVIMFKQISESSEGVSKDCDIGIICLSREGVQKLKGSFNLSSFDEESNNFSIQLHQVNFKPFTEE